MRCECCKTTYGNVRERRTTFLGKEYRTNLCTPCKENGHFVGNCNGCYNAKGVVTAIWTCQQLTHVATVHRGLVERRINEPDEPNAGVAGSRKIGEIHL